MAEEVIVGKLRKFLNEDISTEKECCAVYLMVELRKLLDHQKIKDQYLTLRFYCDWTVHINKERHMEGIAWAIETLNEYSSTLPPKEKHYNSVIESFLGMAELRREMATFLINNGLQMGKLESDESWDIFTRTLGEILSGQPILKPHPRIKSIEISIFDNGSSVDVDFEGGGSMTVGKGIDIV